MASERETKLLDAWKSYAAAVIPSGADVIQIEETRRAFYAGMSTMFGLVLAVDDEADMEALSNELGDYLTTFKRDHGL